MLSSKKTAILSFITVFIAGIAVGVVFENLVLDKKQHERRSDRRREDPNVLMFKKFTEELSLTQAQQDTLQFLLDQIKEKHKALGEKRHQEFKKIREEFDVEFRKILSNEQLARYDEMVKEFEEKWKKRRSKDQEKKPEANDSNQNKMSEDSNKE